MKQMEITEVNNKIMNNDEIDKALHDCMSNIWKAYRTGNVKVYNNIFSELYRQYSDPAVVSFIQGMGMGLAPAVNRRTNENQNNK